MKEELIKLYKEYIEFLDVRDKRYFENLRDMGALNLYQIREEDKPTFKGFMDYLIL